MQGCTLIDLEAEQRTGFGIAPIVIDQLLTEELLLGVLQSLRQRPDVDILHRQARQHAIR